jgi:hypothetical protein
LLAVVLVVAGLLAFWGYSYANNTVSSQLSAQKIAFPTQAQLDQAKNAPKGGFSEITPAMVPYLAPYAGQLMTTGAQAETYANHFIAIHLQEMTGGQTYSQVSAEAMALPPGSKAAAAANATVETVFKGTTLRSMLLNAYGWWQMGQIALLASIAMIVLAAITILLSALGLWHFRRVPAEEEIPRLAGAALFTSTGGSAPISAVSPS